VSCNSRLIVIASVHSRMYKPLAHSTSADSHSAFIRLRVRFDSRQVAYVVQMLGLYRRTRSETGWIRHACGSSDNVEQRGAVSRQFPKKSFRTVLRPRSKKGGGAYRGEGLISENRVANCTLPCSTLSGVGYGRAQHRHLPNRRYSPTQCTSDATQAMLMAGVLGAERMRRSRRRSCSNRGCQRPVQ
jgi:hypothetical protein